MRTIPKESPSKRVPFLVRSVESDFKQMVATPSKKNEMGAYTRYVTISFFEDKAANAA